MQLGSNVLAYMPHSNDIRHGFHCLHDDLEWPSRVPMKHQKTNPTEGSAAGLHLAVTDGKVLGGKYRDKITHLLDTSVLRNQRRQLGE